MLRVHRHGYHDAAEIESELAWLDALRERDRRPHAAGAAHARRPAAARPGRGGAPDPRHVVHFELLPGVEPTRTDERLPDSFELLGGDHRAGCTTTR